MRTAHAPRLAVEGPVPSASRTRASIARHAASEAQARAIAGTLGTGCSKCAADAAPCPRCAGGAALARPESGALPPPPAGGGVALHPALARSFGARLGVDVSGVRVHDDAASHAYTHAVGAHAATYGEDVYFARGRFDPTGGAGATRLAHELVHVAQQRGGPPTVQLDPDEERLREIEAQLQSYVITDEYRAELEHEQAAIRARLGGGSVPRPADAPIDRDVQYELLPLDLPPELAAQIPEGRLVDLPFFGGGDVDQGSSGAADPSSWMTPATTDDDGGWPGGALPGGAGFGLNSGINAYLLRYGFQAAGPDAIGLVGFSQSNFSRLISGQGWHRAAPAFGESTIMWGHTAVYVRQGGRITVLRSFLPQSMPELMRNYAAVKGEGFAVPARIADHLAPSLRQPVDFLPGNRMFPNLDARAMEFPVTPQQAAELAGRVPGAGPVPQGGPGYVGRVVDACRGQNCVHWATETAEGALGGPLGRGGASLTADGAGQGRVVQALAEPHPPTVPGQTGPGVTSGMSRGMKVLKVGGRVLLVLGVAVSVHSVATAPEGQRGRTVAREAGGWGGALALGAAGAKLGLLCGTFAWACSPIGGLVGGGIGFFAGSRTGEAVYDAATSRPSSSGGYNRYMYMGHCFARGTAVDTPDGPRPIEALAPGDAVLAWDVETGTAVVSRVTRSHARIAAQVVVLELGAHGTVTTTDEHPFRRGDAWVPAKALRAGDTLARLAAGTLAPCRVEAVRRVDAPEAVWNLTVEPVHTFFAGGILVHNKQ